MKTLRSVWFVFSDVAVPWPPYVLVKEPDDKLGEMILENKFWKKKPAILKEKARPEAHLTFSNAVAVSLAPPCLWKTG